MLQLLQKWVGFGVGPGVILVLLHAVAKVSESVGVVGLGEARGRALGHQDDSRVEEEVRLDLFAVPPDRADDHTIGAVDLAEQCRVPDEGVGDLVTHEQ
jgi:hypothetical protein